MDKIAEELNQHHLRISRIENFLKIDKRKSNRIVNEIVNIIRSELMLLQEERKSSKEDKVNVGKLMMCNKLINLIDAEFKL